MPVSPNHIFLWCVLEDGYSIFVNKSTLVRRGPSLGQLEIFIDQTETELDEKLRALELAMLLP
jgi:hypothetical protein